MRRYISLALVVALIGAACIPFGAFAAGNDIVGYDYLGCSTGTFNGGSSDDPITFYSLEFPYSRFYINFMNSSYWSLGNSFGGSTHVTNVQKGYQNVDFSPFGTFNFDASVGEIYPSQSAFYVGNIPSGSFFEYYFSFSLDYSGTSSFTSCDWIRAPIFYLDSTGRVISKSTRVCYLTYSNSTYTVGFSFDDLQKPSGAEYMVFGFRFYHWNFGVDIPTLDVVVRSSSITVGIEKSVADSQMNQFLVTGGSQNQQAGQEFQDQVGGQMDELGDLIDQMGEMTKPPVDDIDLGIDDFVTVEEINSYTNVFQVVFENDLVIGLLMIMVVFMFASFVLFGKKG